MSTTGVLLFAVYALPFLVGIGVAWRKNIALAIALAVCTLFASLVLIALYTPMIVGLLLPWGLLAYAVFGMQPVQRPGRGQGGDAQREDGEH